MARRQRRSPKSSDFGGFKPTYIEFSEKERSEIVSLIDEGDIDLATLVEEKATDGWKISISYSGSWSNFVCSVTPKEVPDFENNAVFMFRHADFSRVLGFLQFLFGYMVPNRDDRLNPPREEFNW